MNKSKQINKQTEEFYLTAREYCRLAETAVENSKIDFLSKTQKILTLIYLKASLIEKTDELQEGEAEKFVQEEDWSFLQDIIAKKIGTSDRFVEVVLPDSNDPNNSESESLSDCFADVYQDLKDFVLNYEIGNDEALEVALYDCILNFEKIWGPRLLAILVNLHSIINSNEPIEEDDLDLNEDENSEKKVNSSNWLINQRFDH